MQIVKGAAPGREPCAGERAPPQVLGFGIRLSGFGIRDSGFGIRDSGFRIRDSGCAPRREPCAGERAPPQPARAQALLAECSCGEHRLRGKGVSPRPRVLKGFKDLGF